MRPKSHRRHSAAFHPTLLLFLLPAAVLPGAASARIINVPANQPTLQAAAAAAANGDTILFAPGTYTGGVWLPDKAIVAGSRFLTTGDTSYIAQTVLSGTVTNVCGGASGCTGDAIFEFGTHADGGALVGLTLTNAVKGLRTSCRTDVDHCHAVGMILAGDGVNYLPGSSGTISNSLFANNRDDGVDINGDINVTITNNTIMGNADDGIEFRMYPYAGPTLTTTITGNRFLGNGSDGIQLIDSPDSSHREVRIERNLFHGNQKATVGCMGDQQTNEDYSGSPLAEHVVFANNTCVGNFYGVCGGANSVVVNNIFAGTTNSALRRIGGNSICAYNLLWSNGLNYESSNLDLAHTLAADPRLDANDRLTTGSPAIDYGIAFFQWRGVTILNLPPTAYAGARPDLGAFEFGGTTPTNTAPAVSAGPAQTITLPADAVLDGTVSDDGLPSPPAALTTTWTIASGPAAVTFQNPGAVDTRATFTVAGSYLLRLTASDGALSTSATVPITVQAASVTTIERRVAAGTDDAEESATGTVTLSSGDLELVFDGSNQVVGMRFSGIAIPRGTAVSRAYLQFQAKEAQSEATTLTLRGEAADNAATFSTAKFSTRARTTASATWTPPAWSTVGEASANQRSVDLSPVIQEVVNRAGWVSGNALVILINGTGHRTAWSFEGQAAGAPLLHIETGAPPPPPPNSAPLVSAGSDQTITLPADALLDGTVSDDGLPNPPGALTTTWSMDSGPATVTFQNASAVDTRAAFTAAGTYVLRLTAADGALSTSATVQVTVQPAPVTTATVERRIAASTDDAEEATNAASSLQLSSFDIELVFDIDTNQWVGLRFTNVTIPRAANITRAYLQFEADEVQSEATNLLIQGQAADNPGTFSFTDKVASRPRTAASASWAPAPWTLVGEAGANQRSVDLSAVVQEIVNRPGWASGNAMVLLISGTGHRTARAFDAVPAGAALLHIETGGGSPPPPPPPPTNAAPLVDAGPDQTITPPADAALDGTVSDDGLPAPPGATATNWTLVSGPAVVDFQNSSAVDTRVSFTAPGIYLLRLTAADGGLTASDSVRITVQDYTPPANTAPVVNAGPDQTITIPADAALDGTVTDDGLPGAPAALTTTWSVVSGPGPVTFQDANAVDTRVGFAATGTYVLLLTADDGALAASDAIQITVRDVTTPNVAPLVNAGPDQSIALLTNATLDGTVSDDGLPSPPAALTTTWTVVSGPGSVSFQDARAVDTHAGFAATGNYVLRLAAYDGALATSDSVRITVTSLTPPNTAPVVNAGPDQTITLPADAVLDGTVSDDGLPNPPGALTTTWSVASGPAAVTFANSSAVDTRAAFTTAGTYVLRLNANDGGLAAGDLIQIIVAPLPPPPTNAAPVVNAGPAQTITLPADAVLDGTVSDDGLPNPPGALTTSWSMDSGPATVTFQNPSAVDTRATFVAAGAYVLRLTASDGSLSASATVPVTVEPAPAPTITLERRIAVGTDDAEESATGSLQLASSDIELVFDVNTNQWVGLRFTNIAIPRGTAISRAYIQFETDEVQSEATNLVLRAEAADNPVTFSFTNKVSTRPRTTASASWAPVEWDLIGEAGPNQRTSDLSGVIQEVVNRPGWSSGNALVIIASGTGHRTARAFEGLAARAALLHVEAGSGSPPPPPPPPTNAAPVVDAGPAQTITLPSDAALDGTVSDDGLPSPPGALTTNWSLISGPASVDFQNSSLVDTRVTFTAAGTYLLRLTAGDSALSTSDSVQITVAPTPAATLERRIAVSSDDAEESATGTLLLGSSDLELVYDGSNQWVGLRFTSLAIPRGATITRAYVQFEAKETQSEATSLTIRAQAADNPAAFSTSSTISTRTRTTAQATWAPPAWAVVGEAGANQRTPDLSAVVQQVVSRTGWASGNALVLVINGTGHRTAWASEGLAAGAPLLHVEYSGAAPAAAQGARASIGVAPGVEFGIHRLSPNPSRGALRVEFSLADARPAVLEVLDVTGRRVVESTIGTPGPGRHVFELRQALPPGLYAVRLVQGNQARVMKAIVVK